MKSRGKPRRSGLLGLLTSVLLLAAAGLIAVQDATAPRGDRGPGGNPALAAALALPVARTFDLDHVRPETFAAALGKDPEKIFAFVRDAVAFESYRGALRGARGTLLALAGNATDRALLLASLLQAAGQQVRFAHGVLPEGLARELVQSLWSTTPAAARESRSDAVPAGQVGAPRVFETSVKYNYQLLRAELERAGVPPGTEAATDVSVLVREAQDHVWVQWRRGGEWVDLDPSFADAAAGKANAPASETWDVLPESLYHRIELRVEVDEQTGDKVSTRRVLQQAARACDLAGTDVLLSHQPANWAGPASSLEGTLNALTGNPGGIKPVLIIDSEKATPGDAFHQRQPPAQTSGLGGLGNFGGGSRRRTVPIAIAERILLSLIAPDAKRIEVQRDLFDLLGPARRLRQETLPAADLQAKVEAAGAFDLTAAAYDLFITTGRIAPMHLKGAVAAETTHGDVSACLKRFGLSFAIVSDALLAELREKGIRIYLDSPRVFITDVSGLENSPRLSLDLRHDPARVVTRDPAGGRAFHARLLRGVVNGVLERTFFEDLLAADGEAKPAAAAEGPHALSTSLVFDLAGQNAVLPWLVTAREGIARLAIEADARARLDREIGQGFLALVPERSIQVADRPRSAWWRIDARSGDAVAVTDEGLHQVIVERRIIEDRQTHHVTVVERTYMKQPGGSRMFLGQKELHFSPSSFLRWVDKVLAQEGSLGTLI